MKRATLNHVVLGLFLEKRNFITLTITCAMVEKKDPTRFKPYAMTRIHFGDIEQ